MKPASATSNFGRRRNAGLARRRPSVAFYLNLLPRLSAARFHLEVQVEGALGPALSFISHLSCTVSPGNNGALHHITRLLCIHRRQSAVLAIIG